MKNEERTGRAGFLFLLPVLFVLSPAVAPALAMEKLKVQRQEIFEFTEKPKVTREGDKVTIAFAVKDFCDATIAIEDRSGRIIRHLASGVLGANAPEPLQPDSKKQTIVWDGKDEQGAYVDDKDSCVVRVSLGLKPRLERTLYWSPVKRMGNAKGVFGRPQPLRATPEGVYVHDAGYGCVHVRLFDHNGDYVRTIYPFPSDSIRSVQGLRWQAFPQDGKEFPLKWTVRQESFLTCDDTEPDRKWPGGGGYGSSIGVFGDRVFLFGERINRLPARSGGGAVILDGPEVWQPVKLGTMHAYRGGTEKLQPQSVAFSPDGKWIYTAGYFWVRSWWAGCLGGVARVPADGDGPMQPFVGTFEKGRVGSKDGEFHEAASVDVDARGRVYVADYGNDRVQVFDPAGKHLKNIPTARPAWVRVSPRTGEIWVFSWKVSMNLPGGQGNGPTGDRKPPEPTLRQIGTFDDPRLKASYLIEDVAGLNSIVEGQYCLADIDFWAEPPTVWISPSTDMNGQYPDWRKVGLRTYVIEGGKLALKRDFAREAEAAVAQLRPPMYARIRLFVNPKNGRLYVGEHFLPSPQKSTSFKELVEIDPDTGKARLLDTPFDCEDMAFDLDGNAYLRSDVCVVRYDTSIQPWRDVPFDYGEETKAWYNESNPRVAKVQSAITFRGEHGCMYRQGGMAVSPKGHVAVTALNGAPAVNLQDPKNVYKAQAKPFRPPLYPGRATYCLVHVWDKHGKMVYADAIPGAGWTTGINMDRDDCLYLLSDGVGQVNGKPYFNLLAGTLIKAHPKKVKIVTNGGAIPLPEVARPKRPPDLIDSLWIGGSQAWVEGAEWLYGGVGIEGKARFACGCMSQCRPTLDYFARSFVPEHDRFDVVAVDTAGNTILRIGRYGNIDDGMPLVKDGGPANPRPIGPSTGSASSPQAGSGQAGDEVSFMNPRYLAVDTDRRLFVADPGNARVVSIQLGYHVEEKVALKDVPDGGRR